MQSRQQGAAGRRRGRSRRRSRSAGRGFRRCDPVACAARSRGGGVVERAPRPEKLGVAGDGEALADPRATLVHGHDQALAASGRDRRADDDRLERGTLPDGAAHRACSLDQGVEPPVVAVVQGRQRQEDQVRLVGEAQLAPRGEAPPVRRPRRRTSRSAEIGAARAAHERAAQPPRRVPRTSSASVREPAAAARAEVRPRRDARRQAGRGRASRPCAPRTSARHGREAAASRDSTRRKHPWLSPSARWAGSASLRRVIPRRSPRSFVRISQGPARRAHRDGRAGRRS
jgi:hypothetical protein